MYQSYFSEGRKALIGDLSMRNTRHRNRTYEPYDISALSEPDLAKEFESEAELGDTEHAAIWITGDDRLLFGIRHVIVPGCSDGLRRRIHGVSRLIAEGEIEIESIAGVKNDDDGWIVIAVSSDSDAAALVDLLGMVFAEVSGNRVVAMVNAREVCDQVREASAECLDIKIEAHHSVVIAAAGDEDDE